ncbi:MAG: class II aldolase/adducin family protein [Pseudomonadota bacterium]
MSADPFAALKETPEYEALLAASVRLGREPLQVQGPGGNTSLKDGSAMWVKASGTWLADAETSPIMVAVARDALVAAVATGEAIQATDYVPEPHALPGLRPSIETSLHAVLPQPVVLHTHCVATIALAIRADAEALLRARLDAFDPVIVPYIMPGEPLARALAAAWTPKSHTAILGNHGLIVAGATVAEAEARLHAVSAALRAETVLAPAAPTRALDSPHYRTAEAPALHAVCQSPTHLAQAAAGPYYPDHVVFLGPTLAVATEGEAIEAAAVRLAGPDGLPPLLLFPGQGAAIRRDLPPAAEAMARCLGDVIARVAPDAPLQALPDTEVAALLGWDAEKHRQALAQSPSA